MTDDMLQCVAQWRRNGLTEEQVAHNIGIGLTKLKEWKREFPPFATALKTGAEQSIALVESALFKSATGYVVKERVKEMTQGGKPKIREIERYVPPNVASMIFYLKNRSRGKWVDNPQNDSNDETMKKLADVLNQFGGNI